MVHVYMMYAEHAEMAAVSCGTSEYSKTHYKKLFIHVESDASAVSLLESDQQQQRGAARQVLPKTAFGADSLTVFVQPQCTIACMNISVQIKNLKHWQP